MLPMVSNTIKESGLPLVPIQAADERQEQMPDVCASDDLPRVERPRRLKRRIVAGIIATLVALGTLAMALGIVFVSGVVPLSGFEARIATALRDRLGTSWLINIAHAEISRTEGQSLLLVRDISFQHAGGTTFRAPEAVLGYEPLALLRGELKLNSVELRGLAVRVGIDHGGGISFDTGSEKLLVPTSGRQSDQPNPTLQFLNGVLASVDVLTDDAGPLARLESAGLTRAKVTLVDPGGRERIGFDNLDMRLKRTGEGQVEIALRGSGRQGQKDIQVRASTTPTGEKDIRLKINQLTMADAMLFGTGNRHVVIEGIPVSGNISMAGKTAEDSTLSADVQFGKGSLLIQDSDLDTVTLDEARFVAEGRSGLATVDISSISIIAGQTNLFGKANAVREGNGSFRMRSQLAGQIKGEGKDAPVVVSAIDIESVATLQDFRVTRAAVTGPRIAATGQALFSKADDGHDQKIELKVNKSDARSVLALWPHTIAPETRRALVVRIEAGVVDNLTIVSDVTVAMLAGMRKGESLPDTAVRLDIEASDIRLKLASGLPLLAVANATGFMTGQTFAATIPAALFEVVGVPAIALTEGKFIIADTWASRPVGKASFKARGEVDSLVTFLSTPVMREFAPFAVDPGAVRGAMDLKGSVTLPLGDNLKASEVVVQASGTLSNLASDTLMAPEKMDGTSLALTYDKGALVLKGDGRISGEKGQIDIRQPSKGGGEATFSLVLDQAARQRRGFGFDGQVNGPVSVKVIKSLVTKGNVDPRIEVDLSRASIDGLLPGWTKPAGRAGKLSFTLTDDGNGYDFEDLTLDSSPVLAKGRVSLDKKNAFESASLTSFRLSPGDELKLEATQDGNVLKLVVRGVVADARPFLKDLSSPSASARPGQKRSTGPEFDLDLAVPILTGFNAEAVGGASLKLSKRGREVRQLNFEGRIGKSPVAAKLSRRGDGSGLVTITSANGGAFLRYLDLYKRAFDGDLILTVTPDSDQQNGEILLRDFSVRNEPALKRVVSEQGAVNDRSGGGPAAKINVEEVEFTKLRAGFVRNGGRLEIRDAVLWGQQVGFTLQGNVDFTRDRIDIAGTFVPGYAFNNAFSQVPIVGRILGGGQNEGLFAVNFRLNGAASAPSMTVNPLSALAPGILRRFIDPFGGSPQGGRPTGQ
jgi:AsmA-like C-terminal region